MRCRLVPIQWLFVNGTNLDAHLGGGTVDLISYRVSALKPILQIAEAAPGSGSSCGSTFLNRIFQKFLTEKLGDDPNWDEEVLEEVHQAVMGLDMSTADQPHRP